MKILENFLKSSKNMLIKNNMSEEQSSVLFSYDDRHRHYFSKELNCVMCISKKNRKLHRVTDPDDLHRLDRKLENSASNEVLSTDKKRITEECATSNWEWKGECIYVPTNFYYEDQYKIYEKNKEFIFFETDTS